MCPGYGDYGERSGPSVVSFDSLPGRTFRYLEACSRSRARRGLIPLKQSLHKLQWFLHMKSKLFAAFFLFLHLTGSFCLLN